MGVATRVTAFAAIVLMAVPAVAQEAAPAAEVSARTWLANRDAIEEHLAGHRLRVTQGYEARERPFPGSGPRRAAGPHGRALAS